METAEQLRDALAGGVDTASGEPVNANSAMKTAAVYACVRIISGAVATLPLDVKRRVDNKTRVDASDTDLWRVIRRRPNRWQKPAQFRRMMQAHVLLRGNAYAMIVRTVSGDVQALVPLHPDRVQPKQRDDLAMEYAYTRKDGRVVTLKQEQVFHLFGLSLDGITGVTPITYARETIGTSLAMERHGGKTFRNSAIVGQVLIHPKKLGPDGRENLRQSLQEYRAGGESEGKDLVLEEDMKIEKLALTAVDAQWIEARRFTRTDIFMFFGLPPHMAGDTEKSTSWGTGIEGQRQGFVDFTLEDHLVMWEEGVTVDLTPEDSDLYAKFNRSAFVRADTKTRWEAYMKGRQMKVLSANDVREKEDMDPIEGGDVYENPLITVDQPEGDENNEPSNAA
ncbi:phage portal protein [Shinella sp. SUS2]|nr:phage portal protein [Shinella sp. SUS2]KOC77698.1 phage portal protein [Shinella sp. GWS1]